MDLFILKKFITVFVMPINLVMFFLILAIALHWKKPKVSYRCLLLATVMLLLATLPPVSDKFMYQLEKNYSAYNKHDEKFDYIVVLGCRHTDNLSLPVTSQLGDCSLERMVEALRIYNLHPEATIITSGYAEDVNKSNAVKVKQALMLLGVPENKIVTEPSGRDTEEEAYYITSLIEGKKAILITNADSMPRAMKYFIAQGVHPRPAPTGYWIKNAAAVTDWKYYLPSGQKLYQTTVAWYESLGLLVQSFKEG
ncbi:ElyC/SanA/YdcF family protein [Vibrio hannami]|uniref:ElyC/SanA/YdcF family protein n=1 Tax=Vibrio hannami TaxID=2717094 RepID=UPI003EBFE31F